MTNRAFEAWVGFCLFVLSVVGVFWFIPTFVEDSDFAEIPPALLPNTAVIFIGALGALMFFHRMFLAHETQQPPTITLDNLRQIAAIIAIFTAGVALVSFAGYLIGGTALVAALMVYMGERRPLRIIVTSLVSPVFLFGLFDVILGIPLP